MRRAGLFVLLGGAGIVAACSSGGGAGDGNIAGLVVDDGTGAGIPSADVRVGDVNTASSATGAFSVQIGAGERTVRAEAPLYRVLDTFVMVVGGDNTLKLRLVPCDPATDAACPTPIPTATTVVPAPTPNLTVSFDGVNLPNDNSGPYAPQTAEMRNPAGVLRTIGGTQSLNPFRISLAECWVAAGDDLSGGAGSRTLCGTDTLADVDHCVIRWYGEGFGVGANDAMAELRVTGSVAFPISTLWADGTRLDVTSPAVDMRYLEGNMQANAGFGITTAYVATAGTILLVDAGFCNQGGAERLVVTSAAGFVVPNLP